MNVDTLLMILYNEENSFSQRVNIFFLMQSFLIVSFISSLSIENIEWISAILSFAGSVICVLTAINNYAEVKDIEKIRERILEIEKNLKFFKTESGFSNKIVGVYFPIFFAMIWILFIVFMPIR